MRRNWLHSLVCVWTAGAIAGGGCRTAPVAAPRPPPPVVTPAPAASPPTGGGRAAIPIVTDAVEGRLTAMLATARAVSPDVTIAPLSAPETDALIARLEPLPDLEGKPAPSLRPASLAPPRTANVQPIAFVRPTGKAIADLPISQAPSVGVALSPPQILPVGEVQAEAEIRVRFEEPMVPIAAVGANAPAIATITPAIAGTWRWLDTRVAQFTAKAARLPQATEFEIKVAAGLRAVSGATLAETRSATFSTPPVMIRGLYPTVTVRPDSPVLVELDQRIDPAVIAKALRVETARKRRLAFKTMSLDDARVWWAKNPSIGFDRSRIGANWVIIAPQTAWPAGAELRVVLGKQAPSLEGPRLSSQETAGTFDVAEPFVTRGLACDGKAPRLTGAVCGANGAVDVTFSNEVDRHTYRATRIQIEGHRLDDHVPYGDQVTLETPHRVGRSYTIAIEDGVTDVYGQPLGGAKRLSFTTGRQIHSPYLSVRDGLFVLDPRFEIPQWVLHTQAIDKLDVELYQVQPSDYFAFQDYEEGKRATPPGKRVYQRAHPVGARRAATARVDLRPALSPSGTGHVIAIAKATPAAQLRIDPLERKRVAWIQVSRLGLTARIDGERVHAWTQDITPASFLKPLPGVATSLLVERRSDAPAAVTTDAEGHAAYELLPFVDRGVDDYPSAILLARSSADSAFTAIGGRHQKTRRHEQARWYVTDDRFTYKPGETVYVKGWVRWTHDGVNPDLTVPNAGDTITWSLADSRGNKIGNGVAKLTAQGGFDLEAVLPPNANLGTASFSFETRQQAIRHPISVEEFRTPAYAVTLDDDVTHAGATPLVAGESIEMRTEAKYYAGGGLAGARIQWDATLRAAAYQPPGWDRFTFRPAPPVRRAGEDDRDDVYAATSAAAEGSLAGDSTSGIVFGVAAVPAGGPSILAVDATVTDLDRQTIRASSRKILVHPSALYVGVRQRPDSRDRLQLVVTDIDGNLVPGVPIDVTIEGVLGSERHRDDAEVQDRQHCKLVSATEPVTCGYTRKDLQFAYSLVAHIRDARQRPNSVAYAIPWYGTSDPDFAVVPDKRLYKPGDTAKLEIKSKVVPATAIVSFARQGVIVQKRVELATASTTVELPITEAYLQNVYVVVDRVAKRRHQNGGSKLPLPEHTTTEANLPVDTDSVRLDMRTRPLQPLVEPGEPASFEVEVKHDDRPVAGAEVALLVVDEAVLALSARSHADPLAPFYRAVDDGTSTASTLGMVDDAGYELAGVPGFERWNLDDPTHGGGTGTGYGYGSGRGAMGGRSSSMPSVRVGSAVVKARKDFRATAVFSPTLVTDEHGKARVTVKMPDSLTRFRIVALATAKTYYFGKAESHIVTQRKINARTVAPRFLTQGDVFSLPVVVQNLDRKPRTIDVAVRAANLTGAGPAGQRVMVPGGQRAEVRFDFATKARGPALIQTIAVSEAFADASNVGLQVYEPATTEAFATYGNLDDKPQFERLEVPADIFADVGGFETEVSSTQLQALTDAFWYLHAYPFECAEQRSSRMLATAAMYDILDAFSAAATGGSRRPSRTELEAQRVLDKKKLGKDQLADGGWGYFATMKSDPFVSMQVLSALAAQGEKGAVVQNAIAYVEKQVAARQASLDAKVKRRQGEPATIEAPDTRLDVQLVAAGLSTLAATGLEVTARAARLHRAALALQAYPIDAKARVLAQLAGKTIRDGKAIRDRLVSDLLSAVHETASAATVITKFVEGERMMLGSNTKTTALVLDALLRETPQHALIAKLARGLLDGRRRGRWTTTQENLTVLQALRRYFDVYEKDTPSYTGKLWVGAAAYAEQAFVGRSTAIATTSLDWSALTPGTAHDVTIQKVGTGRMYYRIGITYAPKQTVLPPLDAGFVVKRRYQAVDDPRDVVQLPDGRWKVKLGARVLVQLEAINTTPRHAVAFVDPLPAGFEPVNTNLATSERAAVDEDADHWDHLNMRDNRSEAFRMALPEGSHRFSYTARATTPGTFLAAPAKAEEMYSPETFGRSAGTTVTIE